MHEKKDCVLFYIKCQKYHFKVHFLKRKEKLSAWFKREVIFIKTITTHLLKFSVGKRENCTISIRTETMVLNWYLEKCNLLFIFSTEIIVFIQINIILKIYTFLYTMSIIMMINPTKRLKIMKSKEIVGSYYFSMWCIHLKGGTTKWLYSSCKVNI